VKEAAYVNMPVVAFVDTDSNTRNVDIAIPCNNKGKQAIGLLYWLLAREVNRMRGTINRTDPWNVAVDLFIYRDPEEAEKQAADHDAQTNQAQAHEAELVETGDFAADGAKAEWGAAEVNFDPQAGAGNWQGQTQAEFS